MKKKKTSHKQSARRKSVIKPSSQFFLLEGFRTILILLACTVIGSMISPIRALQPIPHTFIPKVTVVRVAHAQLLSPTPEETSTPTPSPTPTYTGYCLIAPVVYYHHIEPMAQANAEGHASLTVDNGIFDQQMAYLSSHGYHSISAEDLANALIGHSGLPSNPVVVTIDDGYSDTYTYAFPILKKYGIVGNLMLATGLVGNPGYMSWGNVQDMSNSGMMHVYDHTWSHFSLPSGDETKITSEIMTAKTQLEQHLGKPAGRIFAYPYGSHDAKSMTILQKNGFVAAYTTTPGWTQCDSFLLTLHRNHIGNAPMSSYGF